MSNILTSKVEDEYVRQTELETTSWWKWEKFPEDKIKNLSLITKATQMVWTMADICLMVIVNVDLL